MSDPRTDAVTFEITEPRKTPWVGVFFGYVAMVPFVIGSLAFWLLAEPRRSVALAITLFWGCAILTFLSGVRRGVSFRTPGGETVAQIVTMLCLFCLGFAATVSTALGLPVVAAILLLTGYIGIEVLDPVAARRLEAPLYFARLRPAQMAIPMTCLFFTIVLLIWR